VCGGGGRLGEGRQQQQQLNVTLDLLAFRTARYGGLGGGGEGKAAAAATLDLLNDGGIQDGRGGGSGPWS